MPEGVRRLQAVGVEPAGVDFHGIRYLDGRRTAEARFAAGAGRGVRRTALSAALLERCEELGVPVCTGSVHRVRLERDHVDVDGVRARYLVAADGLHSVVRAQLGLATEHRGPQRFGVRRHFQVEPWTDLVEVHWSARSEVYVTAVADALVGVSVLGSRPVSFEAELAAVPALSARLRGAPVVGPLLGGGPLRQRTTRRVQGRTLLVGDAAGYVDALTGEGLTLAFACAEAAVAAVVAEDTEGYERDWRRITRSYRVLTGGLLTATQRPWLRRRLVGAAGALPWVFQRGVDAVAGTP